MKVFPTCQWISVIHFRIDSSIDFEEIAGPRTDEAGSLIAVDKTIESKIGECGKLRDQ